MCIHEWRQIDTETYRCLKCGEEKHVPLKAGCVDLYAPIKIKEKWQAM